MITTPGEQFTIMSIKRVISAIRVEKQPKLLHLRGCMQSQTFIVGGFDEILGMRLRH